MTRIKHNEFNLNDHIKNEDINKKLELDQITIKFSCHTRFLLVLHKLTAEFFVFDLSQTYVRMIKF